jgi:hypothetical protein
MVWIVALASPHPRTLSRRTSLGGQPEVCPPPLDLSRIQYLQPSPLRTVSLAVRAAGSRIEAETP